MFRILLIFSLCFIVGCSTPVPVAVYVEKPKLNLGKVDELELDKSTQWSTDAAGNVYTSKEGFKIFLEDLTKILKQQVILKQQLKSIKEYYLED